MAICYKCGTPNDDRDSLGLCAACRALRERDQGARREAYETARTKFSGHFENKLVLLAYVIAPIIVLAVLWERIFPTPAIISTKDGFFMVSSDNGKAQIRYAYQERAEVAGYVLNSNAHSGSIGEAGIIMQVHFLDEPGYAKFKSQYGNSKRCPASFYNAHMKHLFLLSSSPSCTAALTSRNLSDWDRFSISGRYAEFYDGHNERGKLGSATGDFRYFVVDACGS